MAGPWYLLAVAQALQVVPAALHAERPPKPLDHLVGDRPRAQAPGTPRRCPGQRLA